MHQGLAQGSLSPKDGNKELGVWWGSSRKEVSHSKQPAASLPRPSRGAVQVSREGGLRWNWAQQQGLEEPGTPAPWTLVTLEGQQGSQASRAICI